jgi:hypothetical protein
MAPDKASFNIHDLWEIIVINAKVIIAAIAKAIIAAILFLIVFFSLFPGNYTIFPLIFAVLFLIYTISDAFCNKKIGSSIR